MLTPSHKVFVDVLSPIAHHRGTWEGVFFRWSLETMELGGYGNKLDKTDDFILVQALDLR
jgi:hypothetical protein